MADRVLVGRRADEDFPDVLGVDVGVLAEINVDLLVEGIDEKGKHLVFGEFVVRLVWLHHPVKRTSQLTSFVRY